MRVGGNRRIGMVCLVLVAALTDCTRRDSGPSAEAGRAGAAARPAGGPGAVGDGEADTALPETTVPPPPELAEELGSLMTRMGGTNRQDAYRAGEELETLLEKNAGNAALGRYLVDCLVTFGPQDWVHMYLRDRVLEQLKTLEGFDHTKVTQGGMEGVRIVEPLLGARDETVRHLALRLFLGACPAQTRAVAISLAAQAMSDAACGVRYAAMEVLEIVPFKASHRWLKEELDGLVDDQDFALDGRWHALRVAALDDPCPAVQAIAATQLALRKTDGVELAAPTRAKLLALAGSSPWYYTRCHAIAAVGGLGIQEGLEVIAPALEQPWLSDLRLGEETSYAGSTMMWGGRTMAWCAAEALDALLGAPEEGSDPQRTRYWRQQMSAKGLVSAPPERFCMVTTDCGEAEVCLGMSCRAAADAAEAYYRLLAVRHCEPPDADAPWANTVDGGTVAVGLSPWDGEERIRDALVAADRSAHDARIAAIESAPCPPAGAAAPPGLRP